MKNVCVMGLGYIGLPTAGILASNGFEVLGVDVNPSIVETINSGDVPIEEPGLLTVVRAGIGSGNLRAAQEPEPADIYVIAVPTPLADSKKADMSYVTGAAEQLVPLLQQGCLVILESTSPPGTCRDLLVPILEQGGLKVGADIHLAHCPERVLPGKILKELIENDRVIGGIDPASAEAAREMYATFVEGDMLLTDVTTAEMVKILENTFRDVNIALANESALVCEQLGIDFWEVAQLASRHPRVNLHSAGPGVGGHCISVDPWFLIDAFPETAKLMRLARERNDGMPAHVVARTLELLGHVDNPKVAVLGLAYKGNVDDIRESPSLKVIEGLCAEGIETAVHDPHVKNSLFELSPLEACLENADCLLLLTDHDAYRSLDAQDVAALMRGRTVLDTRNMLKREVWRDAGFSVAVLGSGRAD